MVQWSIYKLCYFLSCVAVKHSRKCYKAITQILRRYSLDTFTRMNTYRIRQTTTHREQIEST